MHAARICVQAAHVGGGGRVIQSTLVFHAAGTYDASEMHRWFSPRALLLHLEFWVIVAACAAATWWQARRALAGNDLSWFYTFEWPIFAGIAIAAWWHLIHEDPEERAARRVERAGADPAQRQPEW
jgi:hypothetical protein